METLLEETKRLVRESQIPYSVICREARLGLRWLTYLMDDKYSDPGVNKIERLNRYIKGKRGHKKAS